MTAPAVALTVLAGLTVAAIALAGCSALGAHLRRRRETDTRPYDEGNTR